MNKYADVVFSGGGVCGVALVGAVCALENFGYSARHIAGTSSGAIIASLYAAGYSCDELKEILFNIDLKSLFKRINISKFPIGGDLISGFLNYGIYKTDKLEQYVRQLLKKKNVSTFGDLKVNGKYILKIIASDITRHSILIFPDDLTEYGIDPDNFDVAKAVAMSVSVPFLFEPYKFKYPGGKSHVVDGGLVSSFPVWIFDIDKPSEWPTFGFQLCSNTNENTYGNNIIEYVTDLFETITKRNENIYVRDKDRVRTVMLQCRDINFMNFGISKKEQTNIYIEAYNKCMEFLSNWDFEKYTECFECDDKKIQQNKFRLY